MKLCIRSQDRKVLKEQKFLQIEEVENRTYKYGDIGKVNEYAIKDDNVLLGIYATEKRALEVLDEIQKILMPPITFLVNKEFAREDMKTIINEDVVFVRNDAEIKPLYDDYVYEMPKE